MADVQQIINNNSSPTIITLSKPVLFDFPQGGPIAVVGSTSVPFVELLLTNNSDIHVTGMTATSTVVVPDDTAATVINNNPSGALLAATGKADAGAAAVPNVGDTLEGLAGANQFVTAIGGRDAVLLNGSSNALTSNGDDVVLVGGPSTITAAFQGFDTATMTASTVLAFINQSTSGITSTIAGAAGGIVSLAGPGNTSISAGPGTEY